MVTASGGGGIGVDPRLPGPNVAIEERATPHCRSFGELRSHVAARLTDLEEPVIRSARFTVFANYRGQWLSGLPAAYPSLFDELSARPADDKSVGLFCSHNAKSAVVLFDGCSLFSSRAKRSRQAATAYGWMPTGGWPY